MTGHRASYRFGVDWIAMNDDAASFDALGSDDPNWTFKTTDEYVEHVSGYVSTLLLADLFGKDPYDVARAIVRKRKQLRKESKL